MKKIYLACALTYAPEEFKKSIEAFKEKLRKRFEVLDFLGLVEGTPRDVFLKDTKNVTSCDILIADCSYPAIGLGYEIALALQFDKPVLAIAQDDAKVTRLVLGMVHTKMKFLRYKAHSDIELEIEKMLNE